MQSHNGNGLGLWLGEQFNDPKSKHYAYLAPVGAKRSVVHTALGPILNQQDVGACVGFTCADTMNTGKFHFSRMRRIPRGKYLDSRWGFGFYDRATDLDEFTDENWPPDDTGTTVLAGAKALKANWFINEYRWAWDMSGFLAALQRQPVMLGTLWTSGMSDPNSEGLIRPTGDLVGGHAYMAYGLSYTKQRIKCRNHWTADWGIKGDFYIGLDDVDWLISQQGEVLVPIPV